LGCAPLRLDFGPAAVYGLSARHND